MRSAASAGDGGTDLPIVPLGAAAVGAGAALVWLRRRAQRDAPQDPSPEDRAPED